MTTRSTILIVLLAATSTLQAQTAAKTFNKTFNAEGKGTVVLDLPGAIDLKLWDSPTIRIEISVSLPSGNNAMLNELATVGRYNLIAKPSADQLLVNAPNMAKQVRVKGETILETLSFVVFVPKDMKIEMRNQETLAEVKKK